MTWDAVIFDFEDTLVDISGRRLGRLGPAYYNGARNDPPVLDRAGRPVLETVGKLVEAEVPVAVVTTSPEAVMRRWFQDQQFTHPVTVIGFHDTVLHRPSPHPLHEALSQLGIPSSARVLSVGDSADDIEASRRAGLTVGTVRSSAPLSSPPDFFLPTEESFFDEQRAHALVGDLGHRGPGGVLRCEMANHVCYVGGRFRERPKGALTELLDRGRAEPWSDEIVELACRLVLHALGGQPGSAVCTVVPPHGNRPDRMRNLLVRAKERLELPCVELLSFASDPGHQGLRSRESRASAMEGTMEVRGRPDLKGRPVVVLDDLRSTGATLAEAARVLLAAGAPSVLGVALAQEEFRSERPWAEYAVLGETVPLGTDQTPSRAPAEAPRTAEKAAAATAGAPAADAAIPAKADGGGASVPPAAEPERTAAPGPVPVAASAAGAVAESGTAGTTAAPRRPAASDGETGWPSLFDASDEGTSAAGAPAATHADAGSVAAGTTSEAPATASEPDATAADAAEPESAPAAEPAVPENSVEATKRRYPRAYQRWTAEEDARLTELFEQECGVLEMSETLGRQPKAVESRIRKLELDVVWDEDEEEDDDEE